MILGSEVLQTAEEPQGGALTGEAPRGGGRPLGGGRRRPGYAWLSGRTRGNILTRALVGVHEEEEPLGQT